MALSTLNVSVIEKYVEQAVAKSVKLAEENPVAVGIGAAGALLCLVWVYRKESLNIDGNDYDNQFSGAVKILNNTDHTLKTDEFSKSMDDYHSMFGGARSEIGKITTDASVELRKKRYDDMVNHFYNLVTDFYEWGWGQSFHFGPRFHNETFVESIKRAEYFLASRLGLKKGMTALDVGCGVGGPMRNIAVFTGAKIEGITINEYQVNIGNKYNAMNGLESICHLNQGDFQNLPWGPNTFDVAYEIEATCHSPDRVKTFGGVARVLKPGGLFCGYEWVVTDKYDPNNKDHVRIKEGIEVGNSLPTICHYTHIIECMEKAGFEVLDHFDANAGVHNSNQIPWYDTLNGKMTLSGFRMTHFGRICTHTMVWLLETFRIAPKGTTEVSALLNATAIDLVDGGKDEIFTPSYFFIGRKK
jgi:sterol 24-C-methyltransferase